MKLAETTVNGNLIPTGQAESLHDHNNGEALERTPLILVKNDATSLPEGISAAAQQGVEPDTDVVISEAKAWHDFGLNVIPVLVGTTQAAVAVTRWIADLSYQAIDSHWAKHPDHKAGFVVGENLIVFRTNCNESNRALVTVLSRFRTKPAMVVSGSQGEEYYFWRAKRTRIAPAPNSSERLQGRIEILTDDTIVLLPPNQGKTILVAASNTGDFTEVGQEFIDAVLRHNASPVEVVTHTDAQSLLEAVSPEAAGKTILINGPVEGGEGGEGGVQAAPVPTSTTLTPFTAFAGQSSQKCSLDAKLSVSAPAAVGATFFLSGSIEGGEGGVPVAINTASTPFTAFASPCLKNVNLELDPSLATLCAGSTVSNSGLIEGGKGGEGGVQASATPADDAPISKIAPTEGGKAGEDGVSLVPEAETVTTEFTDLHDAALVTVLSPLVANNTIGYTGDDDDVLTPKAANNPVITALEAAGLYLTPQGSGKHAIACPWAHEHGGVAGTHATYFEPDEFHSTGRFKCPHEHLERHTTRDLLEFLGVPNSEAKHKPVIRVVPGELYRVVAASEMVLEERASYFQSGGLIVSIVTDPTTGDPRILPTSVQALTSALSVAATFEKFDGRSGSWVPCDPPNRYVGILFRKQDYPYLSALAGLARQPYFREADGALVTQPGYDKSSQRFGVFDPHQFVIPAATRETALAALPMLQDLVSEFRFAQECDKSAALSAMFTATVRPSLPQAPGYHATSVIYGSGKSYLCKVINGFAGPAESVKISFASTSEEATKSLMSVLVKNPAVVEFDDMTADWIAHGIVNRMLTSEYLTDRILGFSKTATVSTRTLFLSSGNNVGPVGDLLRRIVTVHIDPRCETPTTIEYKGNPAEAVRQNRAAYVSAVLTIMLAWRNAGSPRADVSPIASYGGAWADYCRHPLIWLGLPDPATALLQQVTQDPDSGALRALLTAWLKVFGSRPTTVRKAISIATDGNEGLRDALHEFPIVERGAISPTKLGQLLKKNANRMVGGYHFERSNADGRTAWKVVVTGTPSSPPLPPFASPAAKTVAPMSPGVPTASDPLDDDY